MKETMINKSPENRKSQSRKSGPAFSRREEKRYLSYCTSCATLAEEILLFTYQ
jgi:hypothetical protein